MGAQHLARMRAACEALPGTTERISHGAPTWFAGKKAYAMYLENHHGDGRTAAWLAASPGAQALMLASAPDRIFVPPYVGVRGWIGLDLTRARAAEMREQVRMAWEVVATPALRARAGGAPAPRRAAPRGRSAWDRVLEAATPLAGVEIGTSYGTPALKVQGRMLARLKEDGETIVLRMEIMERDFALRAEPDLFHITDHYRDYPAVLVRVRAATPARLRELLADAWLRVAPARRRARRDS